MRHTTRRWARRDSNPEPKNYEFSALTVELQALLVHFQQFADEKEAKSLPHSRFHSTVASWVMATPENMD